MRVRSPETVRSLLKKIERLYNTKPACYLRECSGFVIELLKIMEDEKETGRPGRDLPDKIDPRIYSVLKFIEINYKQRLPLQVLADRAGMDRVRFSSLFKKQVGMFPNDYVIDRKISKAKDFLVRYDEALLNTGEHLGFHDYSHFYRTFKRKTGMTPAQWVKSRPV
jgi:AraC-like DNA-binding protein